MTSFREAAKTQTDTLLGMSLTTPLEDTMQRFAELAGATRNAIGAAQFEPFSSGRRTVVIAIPNEAPACATPPCDYKSLWHSVSATAAEDFWGKVETDPAAASITITPADLYATSAASLFSCHDVAPVVRRAALYLDTDGDSTDLALLGHEVHATAGGAAEMRFPSLAQLLSFRTDTPAGVPLALPTLNGPVIEVLTRFGASSELGIGAGISPFTTFHLDMKAFDSGEPRRLLHLAQAAFLVFEVDRRVDTASVALPGVCQLISRRP
jgi:hypothetical protein